MNLIHYLDAFFSDPAQWSGPDGIPTRLLEHIKYTAEALALATLIAFPLGMLTGHTNRGGFIVVNFANAARALPTFGVVVLVAITISVGLLPVIIALIALAIPPILVNTYEGIRQVDADLADASKGMGMTGWQVLGRVELPVATPLILLGLRTAAIQTVSTATIAAIVSVGGLGTFILNGLARHDYRLVVGGATIVALLAVATELVFVVAGRFLVSPGLRSRSTDL